MEVVFDVVLGLRIVFLQPFFYKSMVPSDFDLTWKQVNKLS